MRNPLPDEVYLRRTKPVAPDIRAEYFRDQTKIIHSYPFRRLKHKAQVFYAPDNDHICTRIEHVLHVATIAATVCRGLNLSGGDWALDTELAYAIGLGHDLGHAPFGHEGEKELAAKLGEAKAFMHELNSYRVVEHLANHGQGLNLTYAVKDGIICHNGEDFAQNGFKPASAPNDLEKIRGRDHMPCTYEGCIVRLSDRIAYLGRDVEDAVTAGLLVKADLPPRVAKALGDSNTDIIGALINDVVACSARAEAVGFSAEKHELVMELGRFNYERIYYHPKLVKFRRHIRTVIHSLFDYFLDLFARHGTDFKAYAAMDLEADRNFGHYIQQLRAVYEAEGFQPKVMVTDYIAGMTDSFALECMRRISLPLPMHFPRGQRPG
ncbi:MAG TPA: phosphohydrolase [Elusimicrobia bacterium]|nr:phosphohydrolase [Elusimicrobiota bacterium]HBT62027.1 phosphohydrolase [Elusimicrobiota bacterium]